MKRATSELAVLLGALVFVAGLPSLVHACPMCFTGGNQNQDAFLYGSLFLMVVPVAALGGLGYWAYRRIKAIDEGFDAPLDPAQPPQVNGAPTVNAVGQGTGTVLHIAPRR